MECATLITRILQLLIIIVQISQYSETSHIRSSKALIRGETSDIIHPHELRSIDQDLRNVERDFHTKISGRSRRWSHRRRLGTTFSPWTSWTKCDYFCKQRRERYCTLKKKCGESRHIEERKCPVHICTPFSGKSSFGNVRSANEEDDDDNGDNDRDYFIIKKRPKSRPNKKKKIVVKVEDYKDYEDYTSGDDHSSIDEDRRFVSYRKRTNSGDDTPLSRYSGRKRRRKHNFAKKNLHWDRIDEDGDEDGVDDTDADIDENDHEDPTVHDEDKTELKRKNVRGSDIASRNYLTSDNSEKLDRNYGFLFDSTTAAFPPNHRITENSFDSDTNYDWFSRPSHNDEIASIGHNRRWDTFSLPTVRPVPPTRRPFGNGHSAVDFFEDFYRQTDPLPYINSSSSIGNIGGKIDSKNYGKEKAVFDMPSRFRRIYSKWTKWSKCSAKCVTRRFKRCKAKDICGNEVIREVAYCYTEGSFCQSWIDGQVKRNAAEPKPTTSLQINSVRPYSMAASNRRETNAISNDYFAYSRPTKPPEQVKPNFSCGLPMIRNKPKHYLWGMLRIIGGKTARRGQWPWQVAILNRFKEAFCGGTLISPLWVLTAAHCVRKKLYVRLGEHNLEVDDGSEIQFRIEYTIKHPKYDKRTVDNDVAMLRLPKEVQPSLYIGYACLPQSFQQLPKTHQCTIIGWGKRRNTDEAGTNVLHEAEVPIISNDDCKNVYYDYTITKNMFCAGHKRGRIDTCAGDSGGPLLCRDTRLPNQPWTIFGITSFGDGCGKRNKFGIYAKLPNYVDWIWSVINCNGVCNQMISV